MIFRAISLAVGIRTPAADLEDELSRLTAFLPSLPPRTPLDLEYQIEKIQDEYRIARKGASFEAQKRETVFGVIQRDLSYELAESRAFGLIHAATLLRDGRALLLPGPSGSGKTSVCAALLKRGFRYLSDEFAPLSADLTVRPYPLPMKVRRSSLEILSPLGPEVTLHPRPFPAGGEEVFYGMPAAGLVESGGEWPVGAIVFPRVQPRGRTRTRPVKPGTAALRILAQTVNGHVLEEKGFSVAADLVQAVACRDLEVGEIREAAAAVEHIWEES